MSNVVINSVVYNDVPQIEVPKSGGGGNAVFYDTSSDDAVSGDVLATKKAHSASGAITGGMTNNGAVSGTISTKAGTYNVPAGYHNGSGTVAISSTEQAKIIAGNIRSGVTILGQAGASSVVDTSDADATSAMILNGKYAYVNGTKLEGTLVTPVVSQNSTTKVLTIE